MIKFNKNKHDLCAACQDYFDKVEPDEYGDSYCDECGDLIMYSDQELWFIPEFRANTKEIK